MEASSFPWGCLYLGGRSPQWSNGGCSTQSFDNPPLSILALTFQCFTGISYSDTVSATEPCKPCKECVGLESMSAPCVESDNTICKCIYGFYRDENNKCKKCRICEIGFGLVYPCGENQNTLCEKCPAGTYSDEANHVDPCFPCTVCEEDEITEKDCTATSDAKCRGNYTFLKWWGKMELNNVHNPAMEQQRSCPCLADIQK